MNLDVTHPAGPSGQGSLDYHGYAVGAKYRAYYEDLVGPIPGGLVIDHLCRVPACVNPGHLEPVTQRENTLRGVGPAALNARKTHCIHGHPFDAENTRVRVGRPGRQCRACAREELRRHRARAKAAA